ncbi:glycosyltransferase involved in cell wall biosynthesis [Prosthecobacter fusiformis]|uniref:Glycosyltransferase involved in cell wall biosynthesis n=1 Tax=Prosthecobacter fusiformis TaxID=48464 RepID=A0A4R7RPC8_9BACT|nr:glycosyltransferase [Prosthecobacter fusiformis]TDU66605.1 glycosyltransferase involved in cell wall biosynthesis [Prosthecobacter fusiformis]
MAAPEAMRVVWINKGKWRSSGPIVNVGVHNAHSFASIGVQSDLFVSAGESTETERDLSDFYSLEAHADLKIHRMQRAKSWGMDESSPLYREARRHIMQLAKKGPVAVFTRESGFLMHLAWLSRLPNIRGFYELHDLYADLSYHQHAVPFTFHRRKWVEKLLLPFVSGLVCITRDQKKIYQGLFPGVPAVYSPLGTKPFPVTDPEVKRRARTVFYVGHMHGTKGVAFLSKSAIALAQSGIRTEFWGGGEKDARRITDTARQAGLQEWISAVSFQPPTKMHEALAERASLGVVMLADTFYNRHLTCPVKALDYLSHGVPALGTDIPSVRDVLADAGHYIREDSTDAFVAKAVALLDDPSAYARAVAESRARCAEITWQKRAEGLCDFAKQRFSVLR